MSKFNSTTTGIKYKKTQPNKTNMAGGASFDRKFEQEIASVILNSILDGRTSYYEEENERMTRIENLVKSNPAKAEFVAKSMIYVRNEGNLRSISHFLACVLTESVKGTRRYVEKSIRRPDDMTEILSLWNSRHPGKMVPNSLRRAFKDSLEQKFDEYQFKKYAGTRSKYKLKDVVKLAHPSPKNFDDPTIFKRVIEDNLKNIETAQTINAETTGSERVESYMKQIKSGKMGYMASIKNIRTLLENNISDEDLKVWSDFVTTRGRVVNSMVLPFRFVDAWKSVKDLAIDEFKKRDVKEALEKAFEYSSGNTNIADDGEKIAILLDESGSMSGFLEKEDKKTPFYIGKVLAASMKVGMNDRDCLFYTWADTCKKREVENTSPFDFIENMITTGGGTDVSAPLKELIRTSTYVDKIIIFSDMQMYGGFGRIGDQIQRYINEYRKNVNPEVKVLFWNLEGYGGGSPVDFTKVYDIFEVAGFSDSMLKIIPKLWKDKDYLVKEIDSVKLN